MQAQNVARLNQSSVFASIQSFLRNKGVKSKNTEGAYDGDIRQFFRYMRDKDIEDLNEEDLQFRNSQMLDYQTYMYREYVQLNGSKYSNTTINRKINSVIALYRHLKRDGYQVDPDILKVDELPDDSKQIGFLTVEEIEHMLLLTNNEELKAFIMLALRTSMRKDALLNLKWEQISKNHENPDFYLIRSIDKDTLDKGSKVVKEIHKIMYDVLLQIKKDETFVFTIPRSTLDYQFKALCKKAGVDPKRNVSIHSLRKAGIDFVKQYSNDIQAAQEQASHSSPSVTAKIYTTKPKNLAGTVLDVKIDEKIFEQLTHEECVELLKGFGNGVGYALKMAAKKIVERRR